MKRRLFTILSALSLALCLACVGMWVRSGFATDYVERNHGGGRSSAVSSQDGSLTLVFQHEIHSGADEQPRAWSWNVSSHQAWPPGRKPRWEWRWPDRLSARLSFPPSADVLMVQQFVLPYWLLTLSTAVLPGFWYWKRWKANHLREAGLCRICGYDLRASPERCPECGTAVPSPGPENAT